MGFTARRAIYKIHRSKALGIPSETRTGNEHTMAMDALILSDPMGEVPEEILYSWLENIEKHYHEWKKSRNEQRK